MKLLSGRAPGAFAVGAIGRDESSYGDKARIGEQGRHLAHATDVLRAVVGRKTEIRVEALAHIVAIEHEYIVALDEQLLFHRHRQRRLAGAGQTGEPEDASLVSSARGALL